MYIFNDTLLLQQGYTSCVHGGGIPHLREINGSCSYNSSHHTSPIPENGDSFNYLCKGLLRKFNRRPSWIERGIPSHLKYEHLGSSRLLMNAAT